MTAATLRLCPRSLGKALLAALAAFGPLGCEENAEKKSSVTAGRSQAVVGTATATTTVTAAPSSARPASKPRRALCGGKLESEGRPAPKKPISRRAVAGEAEPPVEPGLSGGFTWVNFWAAWCVPCREEIPRLLSWQEKLGKTHDFRVVFVSLDDDERQLEKFLNEQPRAGVRKTYWLREGREREDWLGAAGLSTDPELPIHLLVDKKGKVRCRVQGAVEDSDYETLVALLDAG
ncbi:MAG TPA: TlpA disulfide reductase family protein [Polyangiaceae bacterium]